MSYSAHRKKLRGGPKARPKALTWPKRLRALRAGPVHLWEIMKELWPQESIMAYMHNEPVTVRMVRPWWAKMARERHWITWAEYFAVPPERVVTPRKVFPSYLDRISDSFGEAGG